MQGALLNEDEWPVQQTQSKKAIPVQATSGPKGSRRLRLPDFKTVGT